MPDISFHMSLNPVIEPILDGQKLIHIWAIFYLRFTHFIRDSQMKHAQESLAAAMSCVTKLLTLLEMTEMP